MRVGLNATCFNDRPSGANQRFDGIYGALVRSRPDIEFVVYDPVDCKVSQRFGDLANVSAVATPVPSSGRLRKWRVGMGYWSAALAGQKLDLLETFNLPVKKLRSGPTVVTIHDIRRAQPDWPWMGRILYKPILRRALEAADRVITVSQTMKQEINDFHPCVPVSVVYNGINPYRFAEASAAKVIVDAAKLKLPSQFVLAVGHLELRKNYVRLVEAMGVLHRRGLGAPLVIIGNDSGARRDIEARIDKLGLRDSIMIFGGLSDSEVTAAYRLASLYVFPSTYEGFGIPLLEAMAAGTPIASSDIAVFREISGDQGLYFPARDIEGMASAIEVGLTSTEVRERLLRHGALRLRDFDFDALAAQVCQVYDTLM